jgi:hypothetical protein
MDPQSNPFATLSFIAAPAVLTNASAILTLSTGNRLARASDHLREQTAELEAGHKPDPVLTRELTATQERVLMLIAALRSFYLALGGFAGAALVALIGALASRSVPTWLTWALEMVAVAGGVFAVGSLVRGASLLVRETRIASDVLKERAERVQAELERPAALPAGRSSTGPTQ